MYKVISRDFPNKLWASGFHDKDKAQKMIDAGYFHRHMYEKDKHKVLIVVKE